MQEIEMIAKLRLRDFRLLFILLAANYVIFSLVPDIGVLELIFEVLFNLIRAGIFIYAGWCLASKAVTNFSSAFIPGLLLSASDHIILKGGLLYVGLATGKVSTFGEANIAFLGVLISYVIYLVPAVLLTYLGQNFYTRISS